MPERIEFSRELEALHLDLIKMGSIIEKQLDDTINALVLQDADLAKIVIEKDDVIDALERKIEKECVLLIARQQPIASDLRDITSVLKVVSDLERIGDNCEDISFYTIELSGQDYLKPLVDLPDMADKVKAMVKDVIDCVVKKDNEMALNVIERDTEINNYFRKIIKELQTMIQNDPSKTKQCTELMFITKYLEKMGDHAKNIATWIVYNVTGHHAKNDIEG